MVVSLKPLLASPYFGGLKPDQQLKVLDAYWQGIREVLRPAFDDIDTYAIQKGVGVIVMHLVLPMCWNAYGAAVPCLPILLRMRKYLMKHCPLQGENAKGEPVSGIEFWASAPLGAAGSYSSSAGRRVLAAKIRQLLPAVTLE